MHTLWQFPTLVFRIHLIEVRGKSTRGIRRVFILLTPDMVRGIEYILRTRAYAGVNPNSKYVFGRTSASPQDGCAAMRIICWESLAVHVDYMLREWWSSFHVIHIEVLSVVRAVDMESCADLIVFWLLILQTADLTWYILCKRPTNINANLKLRTWHDVVKYKLHVIFRSCQRVKLQWDHCNHLFVWHCVRECCDN